ncbi:MAG: methylmalonyl Co-A mutase-associated GTPase MeaB [Thermoplasmatota archaeon]
MALVVSAEALANGVAAGDRRAVARLISLAEGDDDVASQALRILHRRLGRAQVVGVTGPPGSGKSTLVDRLVQEARREGLDVGVVCIDPSSPFTGGAILGDRIRMQRHAGDQKVFIRSMGSRGALGGLSHHTLEAVKILDAAGKDVVFVETVGVGQAEVDIARLADTVLVVVVPNLGDDIQTVKAGLMEIADIFVVNKADLVGADKVAAEVQASLMLAHPAGESPWQPPVLRTVAETGKGVAELAKTIAEHASWSRKSGSWAQRRSWRAREQVRLLLQRAVARFAFPPEGPVGEVRDLIAAAEEGSVSPADAAEGILKLYRAP